MARRRRRTTRKITENMRSVEGPQRDTMRVVKVDINCEHCYALIATCDQFPIPFDITNTDDQITLIKAKINNANNLDTNKGLVPRYKCKSISCRDKPRPDEVKVTILD